jgi:ribosomal RNA-processing protein 1
MSSSTPTVSSYPFVKKLAANDRPTRDQALKALSQFLKTNKHLDALQLNKLWKGLFYSMWFSDRPRTQQNLANDLADLVQVVSKQNVIVFITSFWTIMAREWDGIDQHRIDKFYLLIRRYHAATLRRLRDEHWDEKLLFGYKEVMSTYPLNVKNGKIPNALRLHMFDIYLDEIERVADESIKSTGNGTTKDDKSLQNFPMEDLLEPVRNIAENSPLKHIRENAVKNVLQDKRLVEWGVVEESHKGSEDDEEDEDEEWGGIE